jgi:quinolinate synthase
MKMNTLEKLHACMLNKTPEVMMPKATLERARLPIERMLEMSK